MRSWLLLAVCLVSAQGCSSLAPTPRDSFYRLDIEAAVPTRPAWKAGQRIYVAPFAASDLHSERALVFAHADGVSLDRYPYALWIESPREMLQVALADYLKRSGAQVITESSRDTDVIIRGRILKFERAGAEGSERADVSLDFEVFSVPGKAPILSKRYQHSVRIDGTSARDVVNGLNQITPLLFDQFYGDLSETE